MPTIVGDVKSQVLDDRVRYSMDWSAALAPDSTAYPATSRERISASSWAVPTDSPTNNVTLTGGGYDDSLGVTWVSVEPTTAAVKDEIVWIENTIETTGILPHLGLETQTSTQKMVRRYRLKLVEC